MTRHAPSYTMQCQWRRSAQVGVVLSVGIVPSMMPSEKTIWPERAEWGATGPTKAGAVGPLCARPGHSDSSIFRA